MLSISDLGFGGPRPSDAKFFHLPFLQQEIEQQPGAKNGGKHAGYNSEAEGDGKTSHRTRAELK